jgi:hypothetical protein
MYSGPASQNTLDATGLIIFIFGLLYNVGARDVCILSITTVLAKRSALDLVFLVFW